MKLGIMQPYFFPYLGYIELIARTDMWIVFDTAQYRPRAWMNRNRILHPSQGWQYITVPVTKFKRFSPIHTIQIKNRQQSLEKILGQLEHYKKKAPYYKNIVKLVIRSFNTCKSSFLSELNIRTLDQTCLYIDIPFKYEYFSKMNCNLPTITHPGAWALEISTALSATEYVNPPGGEDLFDPTAFERRKIKLTITRPIDFTYECEGYRFEKNLSIIDVLMWCDPGRVKSWLLKRKEAY